VKQVRTYFFLLSFLPALIVSAQKKSQTSSIPLNFPDSVRIVLENTRNVDATVVGTSFASAWSSLGADQQLIIQQQLRKMKKKKLPLKPALINYFGAIANAVTVERADASKLSGFFTVVGQVIDNETTPRILNFLQGSRTFFEHHALHYEKSYRLYARDDDYTFDYIAPAPSFDMNDTTSTPTTDQQDYTESTPTNDYNDQPVDSIFTEVPLWMNPPPQPVVEGPVIRFNRVTLNFVTKYDSAFLKNTKGSLSLRDNTFVGKDGTFDWSSALLSPDSVYCNFTDYNFKVNKAELKADLVKLNYTGKTPGLIPGTFEFKSQTRKDSVASTYPRFKSFQSTLPIQGIGDENVKYYGGFTLTGRKITGSSVGGNPSTVEVYHNGEMKAKVLSPDFEFSDSTIFSRKARISLVDKGDSITHPAVRMRYTFGKDSLQKIYVQKERGLLMHTPYSSTFFNVDFSTDVIQWNLFADSLDMRTDGGRNTIPMIIESVDYYDPEDFRLLKGEGFSFHPLALVVRYCMKNKTRDFYSGDLVQFSGKRY
jgi:hypothetical protein